MPKRILTESLFAEDGATMRIDAAGFHRRWGVRVHREPRRSPFVSLGLHLDWHTPYLGLYLIKWHIQIGCTNWEEKGWFHYHDWPIEGCDCEWPDGDGQGFPFGLAHDLGLVSRWGTEHLKDQVLDANGDRVTLYPGRFANWQLSRGPRMSALIKCAHQENGPGEAGTSRGPTQEADAPMSDQLTVVAREALAAHDALRATDESEPKNVTEASPYAVRVKWLAWHSDVWRPAYARWEAAMDALDAAMGEPVGRHPFTFRPICEEIVSRG